MNMGVSPSGAGHGVAVLAVKPALHRKQAGRHPDARRTIEQAID
jgi:hypothetical protein